MDKWSSPWDIEVSEEETPSTFPEQSVSRFDLEEQIMECWQVTNDIRLLHEAFNLNSATIGEFSDSLKGLAALYEIKFNRMWNTFEGLISDRKIT
jgi:hypothetical protein